MILNAALSASIVTTMCVCYTVPSFTWSMFRDEKDVNCILTKEQDTFMRRLSEFSVLFQILAYFLVSKEQPGIMFVLSSGPRHRTGKGNSLYFI